jgi:hypothetical protein
MFTLIFFIFWFTNIRLFNFRTKICSEYVILFFESFVCSTRYTFLIGMQLGTVAKEPRTGTYFPVQIIWNGQNVILKRASFWL